LRVRVTLRTRAGERRDFLCGPGEAILHAGLRQGIALAYDCATGSCGTCKARLLGGRAESRWPEAPGARLCREPGEVLTCQSVARQDCTLEVTRLAPVEAFEAPRPDQRIGRLRDRRRRTSDVMTFDVDLDRPLRFLAGQFALLEVPGIVGARAYTMTNFEPTARRLSFVVKRKPGGAVSEWLFGAGAADGARLDLFAPLGRAVFHRLVSRHLVCIAGGSGLAGMLSILRSAIAADHFGDRTAHLFFGVRTERDLFLLDELAALRAASPRGLAITVALSDAEIPPGLRAAHPGLVFARGRIDEVTGAHLRARPSEARAALRAYVAGPAAMVQASVRLLLREGRLPPAEIRHDTFN
jgi:toluene monooxygenase electron transfer component